MNYIHLLDGGSVETSSQFTGGKRRLRARLVNARGLILEVLVHNYAANDPNAAPSFAAEWNHLTGLDLSPAMFDDDPAADLAKLVKAENVWEEIDTQLFRLATA